MDRYRMDHGGSESESRRAGGDPERRLAARCLAAKEGLVACVLLLRRWPRVPDRGGAASPPLAKPNSFRSGAVLVFRCESVDLVLTARASVFFSGTGDVSMFNSGTARGQLYRRTLQPDQLFLVVV
ncbi:unnamed protein product [Urochloa humidicola]